MDKFTVYASRVEGCEVRLADYGENLIVPVCMGGLAINGCFNASECLPILNERRNDPKSHVFVIIDQEIGLARDATSVPTNTLVQRIPARRT